jgi:hypothetical protein
VKFSYGPGDMFDFTNKEGWKFCDSEVLLDELNVLQRIWYQSTCEINVNLSVR